MAKYSKHYPLHFNKDNNLLELSTQLYLPFRLHIMNILFKEKEINFVTLRNRLNISDGSLFSHLKYLQKENLLCIRKEFRDRKPITIYSITEKGIDKFTKLRERLFEVLK
jgi:DNA-binding HxlR family transcriptional regulator